MLVFPGLMSIASHGSKAWCIKLDHARDLGKNLVLACLALKHSHQGYLRRHLDIIHYVYLDGSKALIRERLLHRTGHFMNSILLHSQIVTIEPPEDTLRVNIRALPNVIADETFSHLSGDWK